VSGRDASAVRDSAERPAAARAGDGRDARDCAGTITLGIYEKALRGNELATRADWEAFLAQVPEAGFSFVDMSVDESPRREARLDWDRARRGVVRRAVETVGTAIGGLCLSVHRKIGPGSADPGVRERARDAMTRGIRLCHDLGIPVLQVAGYYCYYEEPNPDAARHYREMLAEAAAQAATYGVMLGIENVDGRDVTSITRAMEVVDAIDSPWLQVYPDIGNIAEQGLDPAAELAAGEGHMVAMHAKDVRRGEPRRVPMGEGVVDWDGSFALLARQRWSGRLMIEMWNDDAPDSLERCQAARRFIEDKALGAGFHIA